MLLCALNKETYFRRPNKPKTWSQMHWVSDAIKLINMELNSFCTYIHKPLILNVKSKWSVHKSCLLYLTLFVILMCLLTFQHYLSWNYSCKQMTSKNTLVLMNDKICPFSHLRFWCLALWSASICKSLSFALSILCTLAVFAN